MRSLSYKGRLAAYTLTELLIVLVIIGILILMALPVLMPLISRTRSVEAKQMLTHLQTLEKTYFYEHSRYAASLDEAGFEQEKLTTEDGKANYRIEIINAGPTTFQARATSVVDFDGDGTYNVWEVDQDQKLTEVTKD
ncbi:prepilin-type N-terminal cleavage/methylation domain-containing protein [Hymenobacter sp. BT186]|uniref:Prepilin-type N-terminal cleavage/methylation domain-containing protein n=2 Tax=Hymenobacter telluris TaxID=2816474 RepID=A0A939F138_9BACT|nr:prepilin-type N-terminal cleavage/methylation domain-containing protein [Hymenobacter telluris]MBW3376840.1 type IV pilin protein [Hymenobacter norwichensis]